jgi:hypothetical protein
MAPLADGFYPISAQDFKLKLETLSNQLISGVVDFACLTKNNFDPSEI